MSTSTPYVPVGNPAVDRAHDTAFLIARIFLGAIFVQNGFGKLIGLGAFAAGLEKMGVPMASIIAPLAAGVEFFGGIAIIFGAWTWLAGLLMIGFTVVGTLLAHRFWAVPADQQKLQHIQFMKNVAIIGGFLAIIAAGPGRFSLDQLMQRRSRHR